MWFSVKGKIIAEDSMCVCLSRDLEVHKSLHQDDLEGSGGRSQGRMFSSFPHDFQTVEKFYNLNI